MATTQFPKQVSRRTLQKASEGKRTGDLRDNLRWAKLAEQYVAKAITVGASNKLLDLGSSFGGSLVCVLAMRQVENDIAASGKQVIYTLAEMAKSTGCGNCGEQSALAFQYLDQNGIAPLDWMYRANGDHAFVLIGRVKGSDPAKYSTWGNVAVVCDPWKKEAYPASEIGKRNGEQHVYASDFRVP